MQIPNTDRARELSFRNIFDTHAIKEVGIDFGEDYYVGTYLVIAQRGVVAAVLKDGRVVALVEDVESLSDEAVQEIEEIKMSVLETYRKRQPEIADQQLPPAERLNHVILAVSELSDIIRKEVPSCKERQLALLKLDEVLHWTNAAIAASI